jgi:hypothetical protein
MWPEPELRISALCVHSGVLRHVSSCLLSENDRTGTALLMSFLSLGGREKFPAPYVYVRSGVRAAHELLHTPARPRVRVFLISSCNSNLLHKVQRKREREDRRTLNLQLAEKREKQRKRLVARGRCVRQPRHPWTSPALAKHFRGSVVRPDADREASRFVSARAPHVLPILRQPLGGGAI